MPHFSGLIISLLCTLALVSPQAYCEDVQAATQGVERYWASNTAQVEWLNAEVTHFRTTQERLAKEMSGHIKDYYAYNASTLAEVKEDVAAVKELQLRLAQAVRQDVHNYIEYQKSLPDAVRAQVTEYWLRMSIQPNRQEMKDYWQYQEKQWADLQESANSFALTEVSRWSQFEALFSGCLAQGQQDLSAVHKDLEQYRLKEFAKTGEIKTELKDYWTGQTQLPAQLREDLKLWWKIEIGEVAHLTGDVHAYVEAQRELPKLLKTEAQQYVHNEFQEQSAKTQRDLNQYWEYQAQQPAVFMADLTRWWSNESKRRPLAAHQALHDCVQAQMGQVPQLTGAIMRWLNSERRVRPAQFVKELKDYADIQRNQVGKTPSSALEVLDNPEK